MGGVAGMRGRSGRALGACLVAVLLAGCTTTSDTIVAGNFGPDEPVALSNLTVQDGRYLVSYELDVFIASQGGQVTLVCGVVDTTGRMAQLPGLASSVTSGGWLHLTGEDIFQLPELTIGVRCFPDREVALQVVVRDVKLDASPVS